MNKTSKTTEACWHGGGSRAAQRRGGPAAVRGLSTFYDPTDCESTASSPRERRSHPWRLLLPLALFSVLACSGCFETEEGEPFYGRASAPRSQEFRWSDGGVPRIFDPALAAAPPDTDVVRAMFEGLTDYDSRTLAPVSAVATRWESSPDGKNWTFYLRRDAKWSNGEPVTARDFVRSWQRTLRLGDRAPHANLLENIEGSQNAVALVLDPSQAAAAATIQSPTPDGSPAPVSSNVPLPTPEVTAFGADAVDDYQLNVRLKRPDKNFPALVAHPVFRPVYEANAAEADKLPDGKGVESGAGSVASIVSNGAFRLMARESDSVVLERAGSYWDAGGVALERVRFVGLRDAEAALNAYRNGEVDAVTNAAFEPLAVKLLTPYEDFRRSTYGALTYYSFNLDREPFKDLRVREALAIALDRDRLSADTMGGATEPAKKFLPLNVENSVDEARADATSDGSSAQSGVAGGEEEPARELVHDAERARRLLAEAGYPGGRGFPRVRLLVNRNDQHRIMAQAVAAMWRKILGIETEVLVRGWEEYEAALWTGDYDIARRGMVMQSTDEESNMRSLFEREKGSQIVDGEAAATVGATGDETQSDGGGAGAAAREDGTNGGDASGREKLFPQPLLTEAQALRELPAFPVYFASSYALVKPYVSGFDANLLDTPSLKRVRMDTGWKPPERNRLIKVGGE